MGRSRIPLTRTSSRQSYVETKKKCFGREVIMHEQDTFHPSTQYFKTWTWNYSCNFPERMKSQNVILEYNILISNKVESIWR